VELQQYEHLKFDLAEIIRVIDAHLPVHSPQRGTDVRELFARLAEDRFNLVVVGHFSRGKSSLMNAILGMDRLPTGVIPLTSVITTVAYGSDEKAVLHYHNSYLPLDIPLNKLADYVTERGNPGNTRGIRAAEVQLPAEILRQGFHFIDTPGLGSSIAENTRTTEAFLPEADAFILVTSYDSPLSGEELSTLRMIHKSGRRCFVVLNKQDTVNEADRVEVRAHVQAQLEGSFGNAAPALYSVSAQQALVARLKNSADLAQSGLPVLESALIEFLISEKQSLFLLGMCERIDGLVEVSGIDRALVSRLTEIRRQLGKDAARSITAESPPISTATLPECEICRRVCEGVFSYLAKFQNQIGTNADLQARHVVSGGLCGRHMTQFEALAALREKCTGFAPVVQRQAAWLREAAHKGGTPSLLCEAVVDALPTEASCLACRAAQEVLTNAVQDIAARLQRVPGRAGLTSIICLPHLARLVAELPAEAGVRIMDEAAVILDRLADDMKRFALKQDGVKRYMASREELSAGRRGMRALLCAPNAAANFIFQPTLNHSLLK
jgi:GTP-binding protein EngB required for normal cell division